MTLVSLLFLMLSEGCTVTGQVFFKHAMSGGTAGSASRRVSGITAGILAMTIGFFIWLGLLQRFELSYLFPFEGFDRILLAIAAWLFLKERVTRRVWAGVVLIMAGTVLVGLS